MMMGISFANIISSCNKKSGIIGIRNNAYLVKSKRTFFCRLAKLWGRPIPTCRPASGKLTSVYVSESRHDRRRRRSQSVGWKARVSAECRHVTKVPRYRHNVPRLRHGDPHSSFFGVVVYVNLVIGVVRLCTLSQKSKTRGA